MLPHYVKPKREIGLLLLAQVADMFHLCRESLWHFVCLLGVILFCAELGGAIIRKSAVRDLIDKAFNVMTACAVEFNGTIPSRGTLIKCTGREQAKHLGVFPKELFEVMHDEYFVKKKDDWLKTFWNALKLDFAERRAKELEEMQEKGDPLLSRMNFQEQTTRDLKRVVEQANWYIDTVLGLLPSETINHSTTSVRKEMEKLRPKQNSFQKLFSRDTLFEKLFGKRYEEIRELGDGKNINGIAYLVKDKAPSDVKYKEPVLKVVLAIKADKDKKQREFEVHNELDHEWKKVTVLGTDGKKTVIEVKGKFIPHVVGEPARTADDGHTFDYIVMERVGISVKEWLRLPMDDKRRPTKSELLHVLSRAYSIITVMHAVLPPHEVHRIRTYADLLFAIYDNISEGYRHGDCHWNNWALSRTDAKVLYLFDFGTTAKVTEFSWMATDFFRWAQLLDKFRDSIPDKDDPAEIGTEMNTANLKASMKFLYDKLMAELRKILWFNPDDIVSHAPFQELVAPNYEDAMDNIKGFKEFRQLAEGFTGMKEYGVEKSKALYEWQPAKGERRKRGAKENQRFLVIEQDARWPQQSEAFKHNHNSRLIGFSVPHLL